MYVLLFCLLIQHFNSKYLRMLNNIPQLTNIPRYAPSKSIKLMNMISMSDYLRCMHDKGKLRKCAGCKVPHYCSKSCQSLAWKSGHKLECSTYQKLPDIPSTEVMCATTWYHTNEILRKIEKEIPS